jgi:sugar phosphate permease
MLFYTSSVSCSLQIGGVLGVLLVSRLSQALGDRKSLASALFTLLCVAGLWSLALHLPGHDTSTAASHFMSTGSAYSSFHPYGLDSIDSGDDICSLSDAGDAAMQCAQDVHSLHPIEQCRSNLLNTAVLLSPALPTFAQEANAAAIGLGAALLGRIYSVMQFNRYFSMRCALFLVGFGMNGPKTLVALELQDIVPSRYYGTCAGTAGAFAQLASAYAGRHVALMIDEQGWCSLMALLAATTAVLAALLFISALNRASD